MVIKFNDPFFNNSSDAIDWLVRTELINEIKNCEKCNSNNSVKLIKNTRETLPFYRCGKKNCRKRKSIFQETSFNGLKLQLNEFLFLVYLFLCNERNYTFCLITAISEHTYILYKNKMIDIFSKILERNFNKIGGPGVRVQVDESVISRCGKIRNPTSMDDEIRDTTWLLGGIEETNKKRFFLKIVPNRQSETLKAVIENYVEKDSILVTDGYPSYPSVADDLDMDHCIVNHSLGFINEDGDHTNAIENLWSHLKLSISGKYGIKQDNIASFLIEFEFRKKFLNYKDKNLMDFYYLELLKMIFN